MESVTGDATTEVLISPGPEDENERPNKPWKGELVKSIVYGGLDAIVTSFSLIASISATRHSAMDVLVLGFANLIADGISMGFSDFVSSSTEMDVASKEKAATEWDVNNHRRYEEHLLFQHYQNLGMDLNDASTVVNIMGKYKDILVGEKMVAEKAMMPPEKSKERPWKNGLTTFGSFLAFGCVPLLSFIILIPFTDNESVKFGGACFLSAFALVLLGIARAKFATGNYAVSIAITVFNGAIAASSAYGVGWLLRNVAGLEDDVET